MRFISTNGAPDIPLEVLNAQENDKLIFFCGAGISYPAGLPGFRKLVNDTYERLGSTPNTLETEAINNHLFDRALELLERRYQRPDRVDNYLVRKKIILASLRVNLS